MYIEKTTLDQRTTIDTLLDGVFSDIDTAHMIIMDELEENFMDYKQKDISAWKAERIGRHLRAAANMIFEALLQYNLTTAHYEWRGVPPHLEGAARAQAAIRTDRAEERCWSLQQKAGHNSEKGQRINEARAAIHQLPDEQAAPMLEALAKQYSLGTC